MALAGDLVWMTWILALKGAKPLCFDFFIFFFKEGKCVLWVLLLEAEYAL